MKRFKLIFIATILSLIPINVFALTSEPLIACDTTNLQVGQQAKCDFKVNVTEGYIAGISAKYSYDSTYANILIENYGNWQGNANGGQIDFYDFENHQGLVTIATITYKVKDDISIPKDTNSKLNINVIELTDEDNTANKLNLSANVSFNLQNKSSSSTTTKPATTTKQENITTTKKVGTTKKTTGTTKKTTSTTKEEVTTNEQTTTKTDLVTTKKDVITTKNTTKKSNKNMVVIGLLSFAFLFLLIMIIILLIKNKKDKEEQNY